MRLIIAMLSVLLFVLSAECFADELDDYLVEKQGKVVPSGTLRKLLDREPKTGELLSVTFYDYGGNTAEVRTLWRKKFLYPEEIVRLTQLLGTGEKRTVHMQFEQVHYLPKETFKFLGLGILVTLMATEGQKDMKHFLGSFLLGGACMYVGWKLDSLDLFVRKGMLKLQSL